MKTAVIVNPMAGRKKASKIWPHIKKYLEQQNMCSQTYFTHYPGHATELAHKLAAREAETILVVGGDGTLHEVVNGICAVTDIKIGIIPTGTGNDFCRSLGIFEDPIDIAKSISHFKPVKLDLGCVNKRFFVNVAGVGFDAEVAAEINKSLKWLSGTGAYMLGLLKNIFRYKNIPVRIKLDGHLNLNLNCFLVAVGNASYYGGGMKIVPNASLDDGFFHICIIGDTSKLEVIRDLPKIFSGRHLSNPKVKLYKAKEIEIHSDYSTPVHADGEIVGNLPAKFKLLPKKLNFLQK